MSIRKMVGEPIEKMLDAKIQEFKADDLKDEIMKAADKGVDELLKLVEGRFEDLKMQVRQLVDKIDGEDDIPG